MKAPIRWKISLYFTMIFSGTIQAVPAQSAALPAIREHLTAACQSGVYSGDVLVELANAAQHIFPLSGAAARYDYGRRGAGF